MKLKERKLNYFLKITIFFVKPYTNRQTYILFISNIFERKRKKTDTYIHLHNLHYLSLKKHMSIFVLDPKTTYNTAKLTEKKYNSISYKENSRNNP